MKQTVVDNHFRNNELSDVNTKQQIVDQLHVFNDDLRKNSDERNFAQMREGAFIELFYGSEIHSRVDNIVPALLKDVVPIGGSKACILLSSELHPDKFLKFKGHKAGVIVRLVAPIAIHTVKYDHIIKDLRNKEQLEAVPRIMHFYVSIIRYPLAYLNNVILSCRE